MNYKIGLSRALIHFFILIQISCKKENTQNDGEISEKKTIPVSIDKNYQKDEPITGNEKLKVKSVM